ncbi:penicillin acylase family protein [Marinobacter sp.]|uniref:penicillin acylase family protein n=1 Tax=Marinobacter sp. TaxID=50741 RepID=UPI001B45D419|nr:penicillin acylase family protein [Marinobacter sp.]MBQ0832460.1 penicillin acylase family protein [Marinobacter sp.]
MQTWNKQAARAARGVALVLLGSTMLTGCFDGSSSSSGSSQAELDTNLFPADGKLEATIRRTEGGVPHIKADNLKSAAFGHGYAQAQDNVCLLAEAVVKARSERAKYFGPGHGNINIINDFSYKAQKILSGAEAEYDLLSQESRALVDGFTAGYNRYVVETEPSNLAEECRDQPWVKEITPTDLLAHYRIVGQYASGALFATGAVFIAIPGEDPMAAAPRPVMPGAEITSLNTVANSAYQLGSTQTNYQDIGLGSNAWGIGKDLTEQGRGALLANPHFPYTGHRRLYQAHMTVPGYLNINGAGLIGTAIPLISFNENLAWSHTVTTSRRFTLYELKLKADDPLTYIKDGVEKPITKETYQIEVNLGAPEPILIEREFYFSEYGPMVSGNAITSGGLPAWGADGRAYTYRDANANTNGLLDTWLKMSRASNLDEFQNVFRSCGSTLWTNSTYADNQGNAFYIDSSSVPNLSEAALGVIDFKRRVSPEFNELFNAGLTLLDGSNSRDDWVEGNCNGLVPYDKKPKLLRTDWVQNSNSSYWATNPNSFLTGYSPMFGDEKVEVNPRTRLGITMLTNLADTGLDSATPAPAGQDGKFGAKDLIGVIWNNRAWYAEQFLPELLERCTAIGGDEVNVPANLLPTAPAVPAPGSGMRSVQEGCEALAGWNGTYDLNSTAAHTFRAFIDIYHKKFPDDLTVAFNPNDPVNTPDKPSEDAEGTATDPMLMSLAAALTLLDDAGLAYDAALEVVQFYQPSGGALPGQPPVDQGLRIPWHGGDGNVDGTFNAIGVVNSNVKEDTVFPRINTPEYNDARGNRFAAGLSANKGEGWRIDRGTSWHFGLEFTDNGPEAYGLLSYSQSTDSASPHFIDQSEMYSRKEYRKFSFTDADISQNLVSETTIKAPK